jgi:hypothetical protein
MSHRRGSNKESRERLRSADLNAMVRKKDRLIPVRRIQIHGNSHALVSVCLTILLDIGNSPAICQKHIQKQSRESFLQKNIFPIVSVTFPDQKKSHVCVLWTTTSLFPFVLQVRSILTRRVVTFLNFIGLTGSRANDVSVIWSRLGTETSSLIGVSIYAPGGDSTPGPVAVCANITGLILGDVRMIGTC